MRDPVHSHMQWTDVDPDQYAYERQRQKQKQKPKASAIIIIIPPTRRAKRSTAHRSAKEKQIAEQSGQNQSKSKIN